jgi:hypothetical protein
MPGLRVLGRGPSVGGESRCRHAAGRVRERVCRVGWATLPGGRGRWRVLLTAPEHRPQAPEQRAAALAGRVETITALLAQRARLPSRLWRDAGCRWRRGLILVDRPAGPVAGTASVVQHCRAVPPAGRPEAPAAHLRFGRGRPSGFRVGTPDLRGKRGEVDAVFVMITTNPTGSIGEVGFGTMAVTSAPSRPHASPA